MTNCADADQLASLELNLHLFAKAGHIWVQQDKGQDELIRFQGRQFCQNVHPFWKGVYSKRKEFAPAESKFFPFGVGSSSEVY